MSYIRYNILGQADKLIGTEVHFVGKHAITASLGARQSPVCIEGRIRWRVFNFNLFYLLQLPIAIDLFSSLFI